LVARKASLVFQRSIDRRRQGLIRHVIHSR
jgi:hypothetical protein